MLEEMLGDKLVAGLAGAHHVTSAACHHYFLLLCYTQAEKADRHAGRHSLWPWSVVLNLPQWYKFTSNGCLVGLSTAMVANFFLFFSFFLCSKLPPVYYRY